MSELPPTSERNQEPFHENDIVVWKRPHHNWVAVFVSQEAQVFQNKENPADKLNGTLMYNGVQLLPDGRRPVSGTIYQHEISGSKLRTVDGGEAASISDQMHEDMRRSNQQEDLAELVILTAEDIAALLNRNPDEE